jgi:hypothetical protein
LTRNLGEKILEKVKRREKRGRRLREKERRVDIQ